MPRRRRRRGDSQWIDITDAGEQGLNFDLSPHLLPPGSWTSGRNIRFRDGRMRRSLGHRQVLGTPREGPLWAKSFSDRTDAYWLYSSKTKLYGIQNTRHFDATRSVGGDYTVSDELLWQSGELGGILVLTNGSDVPQIWTPGFQERARDLPNWPSGLRCRVLVPFRFHLVAMNLSEGGLEHPQRVRWSHSAEPGTVPITWDITDPTKLAGQFDLSDTHSGEIITAAVLRDTLFIYKNRTTHALNFIGGNSVFSPSVAFTNIGAVSHGSVAPFSHRGGEFHCVFTGDNVVVHDGRNIIRTLERRAEKFLQRELNQNRFTRTFVANSEQEHELWICFPQDTSDWPTLALIWNYENNTLGVRDLVPDTTWMTGGLITDETSSPLWSDSAGEWSEETERIWNPITASLHNERLLECNPTRSKFYQTDVGDVLDGPTGMQPLVSFAEKRGLTLTSEGRPVVVLEDGGAHADAINPISRQNWITYRQINAVRPWFDEGAAMVSIGGANDIAGQGDFVFSPPAQAIPGEELWINPMTVPASRNIAIRVESNSEDYWEISGYSLLTAQTGER